MIAEFFQFNYTLTIVMAGAFILGISSGLLSSFAVLRQQSLLGDVISHAAFPGIAIAFLIMMTKDPLGLFFGAMVSGWIGTLFVNAIVRFTTLSYDAAFGIILSVFFGLGIVLLSYIQRVPSSEKAGLNSFLFGSASTMLYQDVITMALFSLIIILFIFLFWKEFKLLSFDPNFMSSLGFPVYKLNLLLTTLLVISIVIGLQMVGVVLMSAMVIAPAAAARQWTSHLGRMVLLSGFFGLLSGVIGTLFSNFIPHISTGPMIVVIVSFLVVVSLLFAPHRGLIWNWIQNYYYRSNIRANSMLVNMLLFSESQTDPYHCHQLSALTAIGRGPALRAMKELQRQQYVRNPEADLWGFTKRGYQKAQHLQATLFKDDHGY
ncbi:ABC transporter [bacterium]|nr:ABC transporter [bacterium]|tara:strand:+ start:19830 stop:20957 length:1128 start_codon:yes stop_codon:yes gene_type:complete